jgi:cytochrome c-type biogenesis protein CcmF
MWPMLAGLSVSTTLAILGVRDIYALVSFTLCVFVAVTVIIEFFKGAMAIKSKDGGNLFGSIIALTHRNTRRYGGYLVHMGVVVMFIGFTGSAFNQSGTYEVAPGESIQLGHYTLRAGTLISGQNDNYIWSKLPVLAFKDGESLGEMDPEHRVYITEKQPMSEVKIRRRPNEDLYVNFSGMSADGQKAVIQAYVFPLVTCIWAGYWIVLFGTLICLTPSKTKLIFARTEVVGIAEKHVSVE